MLEARAEELEGLLLVSAEEVSDRDSIQWINLQPLIRKGRLKFSCSFKSRAAFLPFSHSFPPFAMVLEESGGGGD